MQTSTLAKVLRGAVIPRSSWTDTVAWTRSARAQGAHSVWSLDDLDPLVQLSALSQFVDDIGLGLSLDAFKTRPPALVAKALATLDVVSNGRLQVAAAPSPFTEAVSAELAKWIPHPVQHPFLVWHLDNPSALNRRVAIVDSGDSQRDVDLLVSRDYLAF